MDHATIPLMSTADSEFEPDYRSFAVSPLDLLCVADDGRFKWLNDSWTTLGWSLDELKSRPFVEFIHPDDVPSTIAQVEKLKRGQVVVNFVNRYRTASGEWRWLRWSSRSVDDLLYASARDVTEFKSDLIARKRQVDTLELAEQLSNIGHWRIDLPTQAVYWSPNIYRIHGRDPATYSPTLAEGVQAYHPDDRQSVEHYVRAAMDNMRGFDFRKRIVRPNGEIRLVHSIGRAEANAQGELVGVFGVFQDITDRELELQRRNEELEQFAYTAAHDLQAPLSTMSGLLSLLRTDLDERLLEDVDEHVERLTGLASRMRSLVAELYNFAEVVGEMKQPEHVPLDELIDHILADRRDDLLEAEACVQRPHPLPVVVGAPGPLRSVFANLIDNAIKYRSDERPLQIEIDSEPADELCRIRIKDNGIGFDMAHAAEVFGLFKQLAPGSSERGLGMGLALCRKIVRRHGGDIKVEATPGEGAAFELTLPFAPATQERVTYV